MNNECQHQKRKNESVSATLTCRQNNAVHMASVKTNETPEESGIRRQINAVQTTTARANETEEQVATRQQKPAERV
ncbi:hypothetical protein NPIL_454841, partial [Nephila pilipes]